MKFSIEIDGLTCKAETDYAPNPSLKLGDMEMINAGIYKSLLQEVKSIAFESLRRKYPFDSELKGSDK